MLAATSRTIHFRLTAPGRLLCLAPATLSCAILRCDPLKHILRLKMLMHYGHLVETTHVVESAAEGVLLIFPTTMLSYDHHHYGEYALNLWSSALISPRVYSKERT